MANLKRSTKAPKAPAKKAPGKKDSGKPQSLIQMMKGRKSRLDKAIDG